MMKRRQFLGTASSAAAGFMGAGLAPALLAQEHRPTIDLSFVHPELRAIAQFLAQADIRITADNLAQMRSGIGTNALAELTGTAPQEATVPVFVEQVAVPGGPDVKVHVINAGKPGARPAIVHMHGGGYVLGSASTEIKTLTKLAIELDCVIATVDYRLAPETTYAGSVEDNYAALRWIYRDAERLGIDTDRIAVMGESAGGGHAALLALLARDRGEVPICFQMLVYPMLDDRTGSSRAPGKNIGTLGWTAESNRFGWQSFLGQEPGGADVPVAGVPARVADLSGLPPAFIGVGGIDLFVEEDIAYAHRLVTAGVATELLVIPGAFHGFDVSAPTTNVAQRLTTAKVNALKQAFAIT